MSDTAASLICSASTWCGTPMLIRLSLGRQPGEEGTAGCGIADEGRLDGGGLARFLATATAAVKKRMSGEGKCWLSDSIGRRKPFKYKSELYVFLY